MKKEKFLPDWVLEGTPVCTTFENLAVPKGKPYLFWSVVTEVDVPERFFVYLVPCKRTTIRFPHMYYTAKVVQTGESVCLLWVQLIIGRSAGPVPLLQSIRHGSTDALWRLDSCRRRGWESGSCTHWDAQPQSLHPVTLFDKCEPHTLPVLLSPWYIAFATPSFISHSVFWCSGSQS